jgi:hypothetical protein
MGVAAGGLYVFDSGPGNAAPQILEYATSLSSGTIVKSGSVGTGAGLTNLVFTHNGAWAYGLDSNGNVWGYRVDPAGSGGLTSLGIVASGLPALSFDTTLIVYRSSTLWVVDVTGSLNPATTVHEYPINANGTLASATALTLTGFGLTPFIPPNSAPSNMIPTAVWLYQQSAASTTLSVYPVSSSGSINSTAIQTLATDATLAVARGPATFAYGSVSPAEIVTFTTAHDGTLTPMSDTPLPPTSSVGWFFANIVPEVGSTLDLYNPDVDAVLVFPVGLTGTLGSLLQEISPECCGLQPQFPFTRKVNLSTGPVPPALTPLPTLWFLPRFDSGSSTITEHAINSDGAINATATASVPAPPNMGLNGAAVDLAPGQGPFSYGLDAQSGAIFGYGVSAVGALNALGSFSGSAFAANGSTRVAPFPPEDFTNSPVALFVGNYSEFFSTTVPLLFSGGTVTEYSLCAQGMPSASAPLATIAVPFATAESYLVLSNGSVVTGTF